MNKILTALFFGSLISLAQAVSADENSILESGPVKSDLGLSIKVRAEGPATRQTELQIACFFEHQDGGDLLSGGTLTFDERMNGLIKQLRDSKQFGGHELETLTITPPPNTVPAKQLVLIGLGDPKTFTAERMKRVGTVAVRKAFDGAVSEFSMSPNVTDAGVKSVKVGEFDQKLVEGVLEGMRTQISLQKRKLVPSIKLTQFTLEAGAANLPGAEEAVKSAVSAIR